MKKNNILLKNMIRDRVLEEGILDLFRKNKLHGTTHLSIGQEAVSTALGYVCDKFDYIVPTHRCHTHTLNKGASMKSILAEMFGLKQGLSCGLGGSMHMGDVDNNNPGGSAIVGSSVPLSCGIALGLKLQKKDGVTFAIFGDAAANRGSIHEAMNMASIYKLPVVFLCENNEYGMSTNFRRTTSIDRISKRAKSYSMQGISFDGNDVEECVDVLAKAKKIAKNNSPILLEAITYRQCGHSKLEPRVYRTREEEQKWKEKDPINNFVSKYDLEKERDLYLIEAKKEFNDALYSLKDDNQTLSLEEALTYVYGDKL